MKIIFSKLYLNLSAVMLFAILFVPVAGAQEFNCNDKDRPLYLKKPYLIGHDIQELQLRLYDLGFDPGNTKGIFNEQTAAAVKQFQLENNLLPDGKVGINTWKGLAQEAGKEVASEPLPPPEGEIELVIELDKRRLTVYADGKEYHSFNVAIGKSKTPSPVGEWKVANKGNHWGGGFGTRWMGLNVPWGIYGIHGTNKPYSIGSAASHGCFRMHNRAVEQLYPWIKIGTPVKVIGPEHPFGKRKIKKGLTGEDIVTIQSKLKEKGFYIFGPNDGRYGSMSMIAARYLQMLNFIPPTGELEETEYKLLTNAPPNP